jgi:hypothetical protein
VQESRYVAGLLRALVLRDALAHPGIASRIAEAIDKTIVCYPRRRRRAVRG